ncbi:MAG: rod shape-determining protein MreC [Candidatus Paceibacterota bacterium]|jgi:cell shape-determining protein MreC
MAKRNYYQQNHKKLIQKIASFFFVLLAIYFLAGVLLRPFAGPLSVVFRPLWWGNEGLFAAGQTVFDFFRNKNSLAIENRRLRAENDKLKITLLAKAQVESNNDYLRALFGKAKDKSFPVVGEVIFLPNFVPYQTLLIDVGKDNLTKRLKVGDLAVTDRTVLIGRVAEVGSWYSKVSLLSAESNISVVIGPKNVPATASGAGAGNFAVSLPKDTIISIGDRVAAPLFNNLLVGTVRAISKNPSQPNQTILIKTPVNLWQLKWLEIYNAKT